MHPSRKVYVSRRIHKGIMYNSTRCVHTGPPTSWLRRRHKYNTGVDLPVGSLQGAPPASCLGKLLQEAHQQAVVCSSYPLTHICHAETTPKCQAYPRTSMQSHMLWDMDPIYPSTKSVDSLKYNMATGFTGWCSRKAGAYSSPGKILPAELFQLTRSMPGTSQKHKHSPNPTSTQKQK